jgi:hypothetical protein
MTDFLMTYFVGMRGAPEAEDRYGRLRVSWIPAHVTPKPVGHRRRSAGGLCVYVRCCVGQMVTEQKPRRGGYKTSERDTRVHFISTAQYGRRQQC